MCIEVLSTFNLFGRLLGLKALVEGGDYFSIDLIEDMSAVMTAANGGN